MNDGEEVSVVRKRWVRLGIEGVSADEEVSDDEGANVARKGWDQLGIGGGHGGAAEDWSPGRQRMRTACLLGSHPRGGRNPLVEGMGTGQRTWRRNNSTWAQPGTIRAGDARWWGRSGGQGTEGGGRTRMAWPWGCGLSRHRMGPAPWWENGSLCGGRRYGRRVDHGHCTLALTGWRQGRGLGWCMVQGTDRSLPGSESGEPMGRAGLRTRDGLHTIQECRICRHAAQCCR